MGSTMSSNDDPTPRTRRIRDRLRGLPRGWERDEQMRHGFIVGALDLLNDPSTTAVTRGSEPNREFRIGLESGIRARRRAEIDRMSAASGSSILPDISIELFPSRTRRRRLQQALPFESDPQLERIVHHWLLRP